VELVLVDDDVALPMQAVDRGYFEVRVEGKAGDGATGGGASTGSGSRYRYRLASGEFPDPASVSQPEGVHGPSQVVDFGDVGWNDESFVPPAPADLAIYELHVGTFTEAGSFAAAASHLPELAQLGITAVEVMPIAEFPGRRNWGYDGVALYAADSSYGGPIEFARFVDAAHASGLAVLLDVVFNHFGPEGNYSGQFGDYMTAKYVTPWGDAVNLDGPGSDEVREFFYGCLEHWMEACHVDGFRLDAVHEIHDESAVPFLSSLTERVDAYSSATGKPHLVIAESDLNDRRVVEPRDRGGRGMHAAWSDDFHHAVHAHLTGERNGYYADFGDVERIARAMEEGWCYSWDYSIARGRHHGNSPAGLPGRAFVFCTQNHDQVGNRMLGERLRTLVGVPAERAARALLLLSPYVPLLFMGQEYGEDHPFLYFVDHTDHDLLQATREGRTREFAAFHEHGTPPDPGALETFAKSVLDRRAGDDLEITRRLLALRRAHDCFRPAHEGRPDVVRRAFTADSALVLVFVGAVETGLVAANLGSVAASVAPARIAGSAPELPEHADVVFSLSAGAPTGSSLPLMEPLSLEAYELVAAVWHGGRNASTR
jgi:maltooligosyltrehalose trehalohydrolase